MTAKNPDPARRINQRQVKHRWPESLPPIRNAFQQCVYCKLIRYAVQKPPGAHGIAKYKWAYRTDFTVAASVEYFGEFPPACRGKPKRRIAV